MDASFEKGRILFLQRRFDLAEREFTQAVASDPLHAIAHAMLALCLCELKQYRNAIQTAHQSIASSPDNSYCHYALAHILFRCNRFDEARKVISEAIRLNPDAAINFGQSALIDLNSGNYSAALKIAEQGLHIDPEDMNSNIARVRALDRLGRKPESIEAAQNLLRIAPNDEYAHCNTGWSYLEHGDHLQALEHLQESLRINPSLERAQEGLVEALRCRSFCYRKLRSFGDWFQIQKNRPLTIVTGALWMMLLLPLSALLVIALFCRPLLGALLQFDRFGRLAMSRNQKWETNVTCGTTLLAIVCILSAVLTDQLNMLYGAASLFGITYLAKTVFRCRPGWPRWLAVTTTAVFAFIAIATQLQLFSQHNSNTVSPGAIGEPLSALMGTYFLFWLSFILNTRLSRVIARA